MSERTRRQLSIAFTVYNKARAQARRAGDTKTADQWKQVLGKMVKAAYSRH